MSAVPSRVRPWHSRIVAVLLRAPLSHTRTQLSAIGIFALTKQPGPALVYNITRSIYGTTLHSVAQTRLSGLRHRLSRDEGGGSTSTRGRMTVDTQDTGFKHQSFTAIRLPLAHSCAQEVRPPAHWSKPIYIRVHQTASIQYTLTLSLREPQNPRDQGWCLVLRATSRRPLLTPCWTCFMSAAASAKHENFVMSTSHTAQTGRHPTAR